MNEELYIRFEQYLADEMTSEEESDFEQLLESDSDVNEKFQIYKNN